MIPSRNVESGHCSWGVHKEQRMMIIQTFHHFSSTWRVVSSGRSGGQQRYKFITVSNSIQGVRKYKKSSPPRWWYIKKKSCSSRWYIFGVIQSSIFDLILFSATFYFWLRLTFEEKKKSTLYLSVIASYHNPWTFLRTPWCFLWKLTLGFTIRDK